MAVKLIITVVFDDDHEGERYAEEHSRYDLSGLFYGLDDGAVSADVDVRVERE